MLVKVNAKVGTEAAKYTAACHGCLTTTGNVKRKYVWLMWLTSCDVTVVA